VTARKVHLDVPAILERPAVGTTCCASTAEAIIAQELSMLPGIADVEVDVDGATVDVTYDPEAVSWDDISTALDEIGYPGVPMKTPAESPAPVSVV
jgi:copper chaperone CopZ